jgi:hypothetical protein
MPASRSFYKDAFADFLGIVMTCPSFELSRFSDESDVNTRLIFGRLRRTVPQVKKEPMFGNYLPTILDEKLKSSLQTNTFLQKFPY